MIKIFGSYKCFYCRLAKDLCDSYKINYRFYDINKLENRLKINSYKDSNMMPADYVSIPVIFFKNMFIGGFSELEKILKDKKIRTSLKMKSSRSKSSKNKSLIKK